ncbi:MAG: hypothetical protein IJL90_07295, partial [Lachnospiraceae bacterium]|nr:hypothetical protein [Lachnospiraceae bacterium]
MYALYMQEALSRKIDAIWDELVADAVGITAAFGKYDADLEKLFLGIEGNTYTGGRLENYTDVDKALTVKICDVLDDFSKIIEMDMSRSAYELAIRLE